jgi:hypothetical protein
MLVQGIPKTLCNKTLRSWCLTLRISPVFETHELPNEATTFRRNASTGRPLSGRTVSDFIALSQTLLPLNGR